MKNFLKRILIVLSVCVLLVSPLAVGAYDCAEVFIAGSKDNYPYEFYDEASKSFKGIMPDVLSDISEETGINFKYASPKANKKVYAKNAEVEIISDVVKNDISLSGAVTYSNAVVSRFAGDSTDEICFAFTSAASDELKKEFEEALNNIPQSRLQAIMLSYSPQKNTLGFYRTALTGLGIALVAVLVIAVVFIRMQKTNYEHTALERSYLDEVTGYGNLKKLRHDFDMMLNDSNRINYCMIYLEFENISHVREVFGISENDRIWKLAADTLHEEQKPGEMFSSFYDSSFVIVSKYVSEKDVGDRIYRVCRLIDEHNSEKDESYHLSIRAGVYKLRAFDVEFDDIVFYANQAYRYAKNNNLPYAVCDESAIKGFLNENVIEHQIADALNNNEFQAYYQPKVDLKTGDIVGAEALSRWNSNVSGLLHPGIFIPILEKNDIILKHDIKMFERVCKMLGKRLETGKSVTVISCNFSRYCFYNPDFPKQLKNIADEYKVQTKYLEIEITESLASDDQDYVKKLLADLKSFGFRISLDDFGKGYSSIADMLDFSLDTIKIDRKLIDNITDEKSRTIVISIINMAHQIGFNVVCEGIESKETVDFLRKVGCDIAQGYYFHLPMPADDFERII